ncbi:urease accessory protein UreD [Nocardioides daphniae]|uniref:Urease accessory protein UreD n=1 Tax=Nocardioides daphniae TaxID=402297 RepID=A0ABQ1Q4M8_9ACTN|nr:urease accessory protein UreD [Nocardioides daphniae]GGD13419.1 hypothetical protein GCM10007231_10580 [Nocardioides daphniae]
MSPAPADSAEVTRLELHATPGGGCRLSGGGGVFRAVLQGAAPTGARVALVPERALLLAGDDVALHVTVGRGLRLELVETGGTVAYDMRGGSARWATRFTVEPGGCLVHETLPWVSAAGSQVERSLELDLDIGARALLRETLVLGRHGEEPGALTSRTRVRRNGRDVFVEELDSADLAPHRVLDQVSSYGDFHPASVAPGVPAYVRADAIAAHAAPAAPGVTCLELASGDTVWRRLDSQAHVAAAGVDRIFRDLNC